MYGNMYGNNFGYNNPARFQQPMYQPIENNQPINNTYKLNGKMVDSVDVAKTIDYLLDGSVSYYPLADGSAIVTKQLQSDGTSKTILYKPVKEDGKIEYVTKDILNKEISKIDLSDIEDEIKDLKKEIKELKKKA